MSKFEYLQRLADGAMLDIPKEQVEETLKRGGFKRVISGKVYADSLVELPKPAVEFECPLCGKEFKNSAGLGKHKTTHYVAPNQ